MVRPTGPGSVEAQELHPGAGDPALRVAAEREQRAPRRTAAGQQTQGIELPIERPAVLRQHFRRDGARQVVDPQEVEIEIVESIGGARPQVERQVPAPAAFREPPLFLGTGLAHRGTDLDPCPPPVAYGGSREGCTMTTATSHPSRVLFSTTMDGNGRTLPSSFNAGEVAQQPVVDGQPGATAVVFHADEDHAGCAMTGEVVRESADVAADSTAAGGGALALHAIRLGLPHQRFELVLRIRCGRRGACA